MDGKVGRLVLLAKKNLLLSQRTVNGEINT